MLSISDYGKYYLHGLRVQYVPNGKDYEVLNIGRYGDIHLETIELGAGMVEMQNLKPYLRPISCMAEEITYKGKTFVPIVELAKLAGYKDTFEVYYFDNDRIWVNLDKAGDVSFFYFFGTFRCVKGFESIASHKQQIFFEWCYEHQIWMGDQDLFRTGEILELK